MTSLVRCACAVIIAVVPTRPMRAQTTGAVDPRVRAELVTAREAVWRAWFQGDSAALVRLLPAEMAAMGRDRDAIVRDAQEFKRGGGRFVRMEFTDDQFFVNGNTAVVWSHFIAHLTDQKGVPNERKGRAIEIFVREDGHWINPHWHLDDET
jgi:uncharacterized protein DUF4440